MANIEIAKEINAYEKLMCQMLIEYGKAFFKNEKAQIAFQEWLKEGKPALR